MCYKIYENYEIAFQTPDDGYSYFFGYYDKCPLNIDNTKLLAHRVSFDGRDVQDGDTAEVGYFDFNTSEFIEIDRTSAWNWQQGSQLQWLPPKYDEEVIYNSIVGNKFVSVIFNIKTKKRKIIPFPVYVVHPNGKEALGINYERHHWCRPGYNYQNLKNKIWDRPYHEEDGIYRIDLESGEVKLIVKIIDIVNNEKIPEFERCNNWLEHMMYSPTGDRFMFFHRWHEGGIDHTRLYTGNSNDGSDLFFYPDSRFYSHACWKNDRELTIWSMTPESDAMKGKIDLISEIKKNAVLRAILGPIYRCILQPFLSKDMIEKVSPKPKLINYVDQTGIYEIVGNGLLSQNGHITWTKDGNLLLNDSYDDDEGYRHLELYNNRTGTLTKIGKFYSKYNECGYRADLHPRFSLDETYIIIDSAHVAKRKMLLVKKA